MRSLRPLAAALALGVAGLACVGADSGGASASEPAGDACPEGAPFDCADPPAADPRAELCAARSAATCEGPIEPGSEDTCAWLTVQRYAGETDMCEETASSQGRCVALAYEGDGCSAAPTCGEADRPDVHYRGAAGCEIELLVGGRCGYAPIGWGACRWETSASPACELPPPTSGPALCRCACA
ncbi:MAG: hypothetical protein R3A79_20945 [Nannocystaceae bacterium]